MRKSLFLPLLFLLFLASCGGGGGGSAGSGEVVEDPLIPDPVNTSSIILDLGQNELVLTNPTNVQVNVYVPTNAYTYFVCYDDTFVGTGTVLSEIYEIGNPIDGTFDCTPSTGSVYVYAISCPQEGTCELLADMSFTEERYDYFATMLKVEYGYDRDQKLRYETGSVVKVCDWVNLGEVVRWAVSRIDYTPARGKVSFEVVSDPQNDQTCVKSLEDLDAILNGTLRSPTASTTKNPVLHVFEDNNPELIQSGTLGYFYPAWWEDSSDPSVALQGLGVVALVTDAIRSFGDYFKNPPDSEEEYIRMVFGDRVPTVEELTKLVFLHEFIHALGSDHVGNYTLEDTLLSIMGGSSLYLPAVDTWDGKVWSEFVSPIDPYTYKVLEIIYGGE